MKWPNRRATSLHRNRISPSLGCCWCEYLESISSWQNLCSLLFLDTFSLAVSYLEYARSLITFPTRWNQIASDPGIHARQHVRYPWFRPHRFRSPLSRRASTRVITSREMSLRHDNIDQDMRLTRHSNRLDALRRSWNVQRRDAICSL